MSDMRTRLYLCRHGEVEGEPRASVFPHRLPRVVSEVSAGLGDGRRRYNGHRDVDISEAGVRQMEALRERLADAPLSAIYSSDLIRAVRGAEIVGERHSVPRIRKAEFRERGVGVWEGMSFEEIEGAYPADWRAWLNDAAHFAPPGGESLSDVAGRALPELKRAIEENLGREILLIGHGGLNRAILADAMGLPLSLVFRIEQGYGALNIIDYYDDGMSVVKLLNG